MFKQILTRSSRSLVQKNRVFQPITQLKPTSISTTSPKLSFNNVSLKNSNQAQITSFKPNQQRFYGGSRFAGQGDQSSLIMGVSATLLLLGSGWYLFNYVNQPIQVHGRYEGDYAQRATSAVGQTVRDVGSYQVGTIPERVQDYMFHTYKYILGGLGVTAATATLGFRAGLMNYFARMNPWVYGIGMTVALMGSFTVTRMIDPSNKPLKIGAFALSTGLLGATLSSFGFVPAAILVRAGIYTLGMFSALSFTAMNAKEERFLNWGAPLFAGLIVVALSGFAPLLLPARFAGTISIMEKIWLYGGLAVFGGLMLFDTQKLMKNAKSYYAAKDAAVYQYGKNVRFPEPDYIGNSIGLYLNIINVFIRMVMILSNSNRRK